MPWLLLIPLVLSAGGGDFARIRQQAQAFHRSHSDHGARVEAASRMLLGAGYALSPLGEGPSGTIDRDPLMRFDRFDCVTFVETVMALSWSAEVEPRWPLLQRIRYRHGRIGYGERNHLVMAQWIPANVAAGFVSDITRTVGGEATQKATLTLDSGDYASREGRALALPPTSRPLGRFQVDTIPTEAMAGRLDRIPHGTIITVIRSEREGIPYRATHMALVVVRDGLRFVRHADKRRGRVVEEPLGKLIARASRARTWPVTGFHLLRIEPQVHIKR